MTIADVDGGVVEVQEWTEPADTTNNMTGLELTKSCDLRITSPSVYRGVTRAQLVPPAKKA